MDNKLHCTMDDLILFMDGEMEADAAAGVEQHLLLCGECAERLRHLKGGSEAFALYRQQVLEAALPVPEAGWARLSQLPGREKRRRWGLAWGAALACGLAFALFYLVAPKPPGPQEILNLASTKPEDPRGSLVLTSGSQRFTRPAVLESGDSEARLQHLRALFVKANYSWERPLSARSFVNWRKQLPSRQDSLTAIEEPGGRKLYRVQTRTTAGILRSASLTLRADSYHVIRANFGFQDEEPWELSEGIEIPTSGQPQAPSVPVSGARQTSESPATPEDELRVFLALDALGSEAAEPADVRLDAEHHNVVITAVGLSAALRLELEKAMNDLPHTVLRFNSNRQAVPASDAGGASIGQGSGDSSDENTLFRKSLETRYGGALALQTATDRALDASNGLFAQTHFLLLLAREFPPAVEAQLGPNDAMALLGLRQRHIGAMEYALKQLTGELLPLLADSSDADAGVTHGATWQDGASALFGSARNLDHKVSRLLAGRYTDEEGRRMLAQLTGDLLKVKALLVEQSAGAGR